MINLYGKRATRAMTLRLPVPVADPWRIAKALVRLPLRELVWAEALGVRLLGRRLDAAQQRALPAPADDLAGPCHDRAQALEQQLQSLLERSVGQSTKGGRLELYAALLRQLVPDEARILSALSDGRSAAVVQIVPRSGRSAPTAPLLENASSVGRSAGVVLPGLVPKYVTHLLQLGLVELGADDETLELEYELLLSEPTVREALARGRRPGRLAPRVVRQTLRLSVLGQDLWAACRPGRAADVLAP
jgi:hypothetical protein